MKTAKLGHLVWPTYNTDAILYRISHAYLVVIDDLEYKDGDTPRPQHLHPDQQPENRQLQAG